MASVMSDVLFFTRAFAAERHDNIEQQNIYLQVEITEINIRSSQNQQGIKYIVNTILETYSSGSLSRICTRLVPSIIKATGVAWELPSALLATPDVDMSFLDMTRASCKLFLHDSLFLLLIII